MSAMTLDSRKAVYPPRLVSLLRFKRSVQHLGQLKPLGYVTFSGLWQLVSQPAAVIKKTGLQKDQRGLLDRAKTNMSL